MTFAKSLGKLRKKAKLTPYGLAEASGTDYKHVRKLLSGESKHPMRYTCLQLGQALLDLSAKITLDDVDQLLSKAGYGPLRRERIVIIKS